MSVIVKVEHVSKRYQLGKVGTQSLRGDLQRWWARKRGKEDPFARIGGGEGSPGNEFWALHDVSFDIRQGDALGIIGKNGAGKSTLLKVLSRITLPTAGRVRVKGRIASLLEVGTGFNPDLSGRENIFLNGAILGMTKREVQRKFDEILHFSGIERFIDTPVKRYSSGMYVRLAFSVAAHLESEILLLDEVLAVGDTEFQAKCLEKMNSVIHHEGKTIVFVSHNMLAIKSLCKKAIILEKGLITDAGPVDRVADRYTVVNTTRVLLRQEWNDPASAPGNEYIRLKCVEVYPDQLHAPEVFTVETPLAVRFDFWNQLPGVLLNLSLVLWTADDVCVFNVGTEALRLQTGLHTSTLHIPGNLLNDGIHKVEIYFVRDKSIVLYRQQRVLTFEVNDLPRDGAWYGKWIGAVRPSLKFSLNPIKETHRV